MQYCRDASNFKGGTFKIWPNCQIHTPSKQGATYYHKIGVSNPIIRHKEMHSSVLPSPPSPPPVPLSDWTLAIPGQTSVGSHSSGTMDCQKIQKVFTGPLCTCHLGCTWTHRVSWPITTRFQPSPSRWANVSFNKSNLSIGKLMTCCQNCMDKGIMFSTKVYATDKLYSQHIDNLKVMSKLLFLHCLLIILVHFWMYLT